MTKFFEWFDTLSAEAEQTEDGTLFKAAGFTLEHTGGGCTAWRRDIGERGFILITDSAGTNHCLGNAYAADPGRPDCWLIGVHRDDESSDGIEATTAAKAIAMAQRIVNGER
jgi:hypothetical protein